MLEFFDADEKQGSASIYESHITFNKNLLKYFSNAYRVRVGCDCEEGKLYVFLIDKDYALSGEIKESSLLKLSLSKTYARISSRAVVEYVVKSFNLESPKEKGFLKFDAYYDDLKKAIVVSVGGAK
jgi:hypothetical protein